jgi:hypothetical protein
MLKEVSEGIYKTIDLKFADMRQSKKFFKNL